MFQPKRNFHFEKKKLNKKRKFRQPNEWKRKMIEMNSKELKHTEKFE